jgi:hypothetical protein
MAKAMAIHTWELQTGTFGVLLLHLGRVVLSKSLKWENAIYRSLPYHLKRRRLARQYSTCADGDPASLCGRSLVGTFTR